MDIIQLYQDFSVDSVTEGHKHSHQGWVNTECPWCEGNPGYHLGYNIESNYYYCWRCGWHPTIHTLAKLLHLSIKETGNIVRQYGLKYSTIIPREEYSTRKKEYKLPSNVTPLTAPYLNYLQARNFDHIRIPKIWTLMGTAPVSLLDGIDFKFRIIIPIIWNSMEVSFTSRDITERNQLRYISCPKDRETIPHKSILYGKQSEWGNTGICVEGPTDVWRLGVNAFATFGIEYTIPQVRAMAKAFKRVFVIYDDDPQAVKQANKLMADLRFHGVDSYVISIKGDPGGMKQDDADNLVKQLIK